MKNVGRRFNALRTFGARDRSLSLPASPCAIIVVLSVSYTLYLSPPWCPCCHAPPCSIIFSPTSRLFLPFSLSYIVATATLIPSFPLSLEARQRPGSWGRNSQHLSSLLLPPLIRSLGNSTVSRQPSPASCNPRSSLFGWKSVQEASELSRLYKDQLDFPKSYLVTARANASHKKWELTLRAQLLV